MHAEQMPNADEPRAAQFPIEPTPSESIEIGSSAAEAPAAPETALVDASASAPPPDSRAHSHRRLRVMLGALAVLAGLLLWRASETSKAIKDASWESDGSGTREVTAFYPPGPAFELNDLSIPKNEIHAGGPPKDGIPALSKPQFLRAEDATFLTPKDRVVGVAINDDARAYPIGILNYHEIVNDRIGVTPVAVTYCPLCDSVVVYDRRTELGEREFGVSGMLYNSNVLMYDRGGKPEALWSQLKTRGVSGPGKDSALSVVPSELTTWSDWRKRHPKTTVLSTKTGHLRNYAENPYGNYFTQPGLMFPAKPQSRKLPAKERVLGVWSRKSFRAYPESAFGNRSQKVEDTIDGERVVIEYDFDHRALRVVESGEDVRWLHSLWFAWYAFHPDTEVYEVR